MYLVICSLTFFLAGDQEVLEWGLFVYSFKQNALIDQINFTSVICYLHCISLTCYSMHCDGTMYL
jgi:hypothetical protein